MMSGERDSSGTMSLEEGLEIRRRRVAELRSVTTLPTVPSRRPMLPTVPSKSKAARTRPTASSPWTVERREAPSAPFELRLSYASFEGIEGLYKAARADRLEYGGYMFARRPPGPPSGEGTKIAFADAMKGTARAVFIRTEQSPRSH